MEVQAYMHLLAVVKISVVSFEARLWILWLWRSVTDSDTFSAWRWERKCPFGWSVVFQNTFYLLFR